MSITGLAAQGRAAMRLRRAATCRCGRQVAAGEPAGVDPLALAPVCSWCLEQVPEQRPDATPPATPLAR